MTEPIANDVISPAQPDVVDEDIMTTGASIDEGDVYKSVTVPPAPEQTEADNKLVIQVEEAMYEAVDPELGVNVVDLGLVYGTWTEEGDIVVIFMILISPACPLIDTPTDQTVSEVMKIKGIRGFRLSWVWSPVQGPYMVTEDGREQMCALGFSVQVISDSGDQGTATLKVLGDEFLARSAGHFLICIELLTAFMIGIGRAMRGTDCAYFKNDPKNGLKTS